MARTDMRKSYDAAVEVASTEPTNPAPLPAEFAEYDLTVGTSPNGWLEVRVRVSAVGLVQACATALAIASAATGAEAISCRIATDHQVSEHRLPSQVART
jgi:hypothetical protein